MSARLETLQARKKQIDAQIQAIHAREARNVRARDTRRKIVLGGIVQKMVSTGALPDTWIKDAIEKHATERDKKLFTEWMPGGDWTPNATTIAAMQETDLETVTLDQAAGLTP